VFNTYIIKIIIYNSFIKSKAYKIVFNIIIKRIIFKALVSLLIIKTNNINY
jgi:hypothetical protein